MPGQVELLMKATAPIVGTYNQDNPPPDNGLVGESIDVCNYGPTMFSCTIILTDDREKVLEVPPSTAFDGYFDIFKGIKDITGTLYVLNVRSSKE